MRTIVAVFIVFFYGAAYPTYAHVDNTFWDGTGANDFYAEIDNLSFPSNKAGATIQIKYSPPGLTKYPLDYNNQTGTTDVYAFLSGETDLSPSDINSGYFKLNENLDVQVVLSYQGNRVPFGWSFQGKVDRMQLGAGRGDHFEYGLMGYLSLKLRRDINAGEVLLPYGMLVADIFRSMTKNRNAQPVTKNPTPSFRIFLKGQVVPTPLTCSINNKQVINVNFGDIGTADLTIDGSYYGHEVSLGYSCDSDIDMPIEISLLADSSPFSSEFIRTSNADLGVLVKYESKKVKPGESFKVQLAKGEGSGRFYFAPVINPAADTISMEIGYFSGSATLGDAANLLI